MSQQGHPSLHKEQQQKPTEESGITGAAKTVTSTLGNTLGGVTNTVGGVVGAAGRGVGDTVNAVTGGLGQPVGDGVSNVASGLETGAGGVAQGVKDAGAWKTNTGGDKK